jgi:threonine dehydrogenase-like Zn-dependent dehydrogenase
MNRIFGLKALSVANQEDCLMLAATFNGARNVRAAKVEDAKIRKPTDFVVRSTLTAICGSDLHTPLKNRSVQL